MEIGINYMVNAAGNGRDDSRLGYAADHRTRQPGEHMYVERITVGGTEVIVVAISTSKVRLRMKNQCTSMFRITSPSFA